MKALLKRLTAVMVAAMVTGCSALSSWLPSTGPSVAEVVEQENSASPIMIIDVNDAVARRALAAQRTESFSAALGSRTPPPYTVGAGDVLEVSVWEAPPAMLFGAPLTAVSAGVATTRQTTFPEQIVNTDGMINVPFAGTVSVAGKTPQQIEVDLVTRLRNKAHQPQVLVRVIRNATQTVTVVGEVSSSTRMPLSPRGERLLDAIAASGGVRQPVGKITLQLSRNGQVVAMPLDVVIQDPTQNIYLQPGDVVTALFQPLSFTSLGATGKNEEISFEARGITLAQALGRMAGVKDFQADARGMFIFRFEQPEMLERRGSAQVLTPDGRVPIVYRVDLKDPRSFLVAQNFPMQHRDVVYVSNSPAAELQKFLNIVGAVVAPIFGIQAITDQ